MKVINPIWRLCKSVVWAVICMTFLHDRRWWHPGSQYQPISRLSAAIKPPPPTDHITITATSLSLALCISLTLLPVFTSNPTTWTLMMGWKLQGNQILLVSAVTGHISVFQSICPQSGLKLRSWGIESTRTEQSGTCSEADYFWLRRRDNGKYEEQNMYRLLRCRG